MEQKTPQNVYNQPTFENLTSEDVKILQHEQGRELNDWDEADDYICITPILYNKLVKWDVPPNFYACDKLPEDISKNQFFIAKTCEREYLVNTEGFSYARYVSKLIVCVNESEYTDYEFSLIKHFGGHKVKDWSYANNYINPICISKSLYDKLPKLSVSLITPRDTLPEEIYKKKFFIATLGKNWKFIVNTEGYLYSKYVAPIKFR